jgi:hypothetical protein
LSAARNKVTKGAIIYFFNSLIDACLSFKCTPADVYNVDETSFKTKGKKKMVVAVRGSRAIWTNESTDSYHLTIVAAAAADGMIVPPAFILPGMSCETTVLDDCGVAGALVACSPKAFMTSELFNAWLERFGEWKLHERGARPAVLVLDNCSSHLSPESLPICVAYGIKLVCLPPNATHLLQPLDVSVFRGLKSDISRKTTERLQALDTTSLPRSEAISVACAAFKSLVAKQNYPRTTSGKPKADPVKSGFATCGVWPLSLPAMLRRLALQEANGIKGDLGIAAWIRTKEVVRQEILTVPANRKERKRVATGSEWFGRDELHAAAAKPRKRTK